jgi:L-iditol 2-dehydrogenase
LFDKPDWLGFEIAALLEPLACVAQAISLLDLQSDSKALIIGPGAIGLMFVAGFRAMGVHDVTLAGRNESRLSIGAQLGASVCQTAEVPLSQPHGYDIVVECTGQIEIWEKSVDYSRRGGTVVLFGGCATGTRASFDTNRLHYDQITLLSPFHFGTQAVRLAREWLLDTRIDLSPLLSGERTLDDGVKVFEDLKAGKGVKYVFRP